MDSGVFCIDNFEEHASLLLRIEYELESIKEEDLPQRSMFEDFIPYTHLHSTFEFLQLEAPSVVTSYQQAKMLKEKRKRQSEKEKLKDTLENPFKMRIVELLKVSELALHIKDCCHLPSSDCVYCTSLLAKDSREPMINCLLKSGMLSESFRIALRAAAMSKGV